MKTVCLPTIFLILFITLQGPTPGPPKPGNENEKQTQSKEGKPTNSQASTKYFVGKTIINTKITSPEINNKETKIENHNSKDESPTNRRLMYFTAVLAIVACLQLIILGVQFFSIRRTQRITERAWIMISFKHPYEPGNTVIKYEIINTGKTPAHIKDIITTGFGEFNDKLTQIPSGKLFTNMTIFPNETVLRREPIINPMNVSSKHPIFLWGVIIYDDVFRKRHFTRFCKIYDPDTKLFSITQDIKPEQNNAT